MFKHLRSNPITYSQYFIAKQHLGKTLIEKIPSEILRSTHIIEIGPGYGRLTEFLLPVARRLTAIEVDYNFWRHLREQYAGKHIDILCGDFLDYELPNGPYTIVSNLPFFLARTMILKCLKAKSRPKAMYVIVQRELRDELLGLAHKYGYTLKVLHTMRRADYEPMPRVESEFVEIIPR